MCGRALRNLDSVENLILTDGNRVDLNVINMWLNGQDDSLQPCNYSGRFCRVRQEWMTIEGTAEVFEDREAMFAEG